MNRVLLGWQASDEELRGASAALPGAHVDRVDVHPSLSPYDCAPEAMERCAQGADVVLAWTMDNGVLARLPNLKLLAWLHSGTDPIDTQVLESRGIALTNVAGANADAVAEHAFALALGLMKRIPERSARVREALWVPLWQPETSARLLKGATMVVVGVGAIGARVARLAKAFQMEVLGVRRSAEPHEAVDEMFGTDRMQEALARADIVVVAVPLTDSTRALFGHEEIAAMPRSAYLINVCRGHVVDEIAIHEALESGSIGGFASDVWWTYPHHIPEGWHYSVPSRLAVHRHPKTLPTADHASDVIEVRDQMIERALLNVKEFLAGGSPPNLLFDGTGWARRP